MSKEKIRLLFVDGLYHSTLCSSDFVTLKPLKFEWIDNDGIPKNLKEHDISPIIYDADCRVSYMSGNAVGKFEWIDRNNGKFELLLNDNVFMDETDYNLKFTVNGTEHEYSNQNIYYQTIEVK